MEVDQNGQMGFTISQTSTSGAGLDVDFALWGPYSSLAAGCGSPFPTGTPIDCSYSTAATETVSIPNAQVGQTYILLITNFSNSAGTINFSQTSGSGSSDCSFTCGVALTATPGACSNNTYTLNGNLTVTAGPGISVPNSGTVTITSSCGGTQTFNAPFTNIPYSFTGLPANGAGCTVTATFSNFPTCNTVQNYTAPASCVSPCSISSVTATPSACSGNLYGVNGQISFTNPPTIGTLTVTGSCGGTQTFNAPFASPLNYSFSNLTANGAACSVTATFSANTACTNTANYTAPAACNCSISSLSATPSACSNDLYSVNGSLSFVNPPSTGTLTVSTPCGGTQTFNAPFTSPLNFSFSNLTANGSSCVVTATFSANSGCTLTQNYTAPASCTTPTGCVTDPFCTGNTYTFPAGTNQTDASITYPGNNYDCLFSSPNPQWYYMEISQAGTLDINMSNSNISNSSVDIDFILYGPYPNYANAMSYCNNFGTATTGSNLNTVVDCSFSTAATETANIANAQVGEVYILLITNFSNTATNISFSGIGTAATDCSIITPTCSFTGFTGTVSACNGTTNSYTITGSISYTDPPTTGTLTLTNSCGGSQTFNAPFGISQNYSLTGNANGANCVITASFSADASCSATLNYTAPPSCTCPAEVGTYNTNIIGNSNSTNMLCFGDTLDITSNNNWTPPAEIIGATDPNSPNYDPTAPVYDPGISWLVYSCPPSVALNPAQSTTTGLSIPDDPCLLAVVANTPDVFDVNDLSLINAFPAGTFTNNTVYLVPLTMYSVQDGIYSYVVLPAQDCYELGTPIVVQYLPQITFTQTQNCANGTVTATISGGAAQLNGTNFSIVPGSINPASAQAVNSTTNNGGTITIGGLQTGPYSFQIQDANGCPITVNGNYTGAQIANLTYSDDLLCINDPNPVATVTGTQGGTFSSGNGLSLNSSNGTIDLANSLPGVYTITYTTPGPLCPGTATYTITIEDFPIVDGGPDITTCVGNQITLSGEGAVSYTWNLGMVNGTPYLPNIGETEFIVLGTTNAGCSGTDTVLVTVLEDCIEGDEIVFWVPNTFTPDNDQFNQNWHVVFYSGFDPFFFDLYLYNRWGELIWESHDVNAGWDGTYFNGRKCPDGVYTWKIRFKTLNSDDKRTAVGHLNLLR
jgi:gliding motility-associated-like protein